MSLDEISKMEKQLRDSHFAARPLREIFKMGGREGQELWHSRLSRSPNISISCQSATSSPSCSASKLVSWEGSRGRPSTWATATHMEDQDRVLGSWLQPGPGPAMLPLGRRTNAWKIFLSLPSSLPIPSLCPSNTYIHR